MLKILNDNVLAAGITSHVIAVLVSMVTVAGADTFFSIVYPFSWAAITLGIYAALKLQCNSPLKSWRFYLAAIAALIPIIGVISVLIILRSNRSTGSYKSKNNPILLLILILLLAILFIFVAQQQDSYFKDKNRSAHYERRI